MSVFMLSPRCCDRSSEASLAPVRFVPMSPWLRFSIVCIESGPPIPIEKIMANTLLLYGGNGERLRPEQGYPLRQMAAILSSGCILGSP
jgi:hypothetical protein